MAITAHVVTRVPNSEPNKNEFIGLLVQTLGSPENMRDALKQLNTQQKVDELIALGEIEFLSVKDGKVVSQSLVASDSDGEPLGPSYGEDINLFKSSSTYTYLFENGNWTFSRAFDEFQNLLAM